MAKEIIIQIITGKFTDDTNPNLPEKDDLNVSFITSPENIEKTVESIRAVLINFYGKECNL